MCHNMWLVKCSFRVKDFPQRSHRNGVSFVCDLIWFTKWSFLVYFLPHIWQWCGVSPIGRGAENKLLTFNDATIIWFEIFSLFHFYEFYTRYRKISNILFKFKSHFDIYLSGDDNYLWIYFIDNISIVISSF